MTSPVEACAEALCDVSAAVLVGAGASAAAELPTWTGLLDAMAAALPGPHGDAVHAFAKERQFLEAAEVARLAIRDDAKWNSFFEPFVTVGKTTSAWNLVCSLGLGKMVTTNWDNIGENSFAAVWTRAAAEHVGVEELLTPLVSLHPHIIHVHGKAPRWNTLVFTNSQYRDVERDARYRDFWVDLLVKRRLLVVGFSGADPAFQRIRAIIDDLGIAHLAAPFVIHPRSSPIHEQFGARATSLPYDDSSGHEPLADLLRELREALKAIRATRGISDNPFERAGVSPVYLRGKDELLLALAGVDFRSLCDSESLIALTALLQQLKRTGSSSLDEVTDETVAGMRVSRAEASEAAASAIRIARGHGWITGDESRLRASSLIPTPSDEPLTN